MWTPEEFSTSTVDWAGNETDVSLAKGKFLPWDDYWKHAQSLGADEARAREHFDSVEDLVITYKGEQLYVGAAHFQFVVPKAVISDLLPIPSQRPMGQVRLLDIALNESGYLRFCTPEWWVHHMGNTLESEHPKLLTNNQNKPTQRFWQKGIPRRIVSWLYHRTFEILYRTPSQ